MTGLPDTATVSVACDGAGFDAWRVSGEGAIEVETSLDTHTFRIETGYRGRASVPNASSAEARPGAPIETLYVPAAGGCGAACC